MHMICAFTCVHPPEDFSISHIVDTTSQKDGDTRSSSRLYPRMILGVEEFADSENLQSQACGS